MRTSRILFVVSPQHRVGISHLMLILATCGMALSVAADAEAPTANVWRDYLEAREKGEEPILPDFSHAGYHRGEKPIPDVRGPVFDVTRFGAVPDNDQSDEEAIRAAIAAAETAGGGIVFFPPGKYLVWTERDRRQTILVRHSNIILRGSGSREGGTVIHQVHDGLRQPRPGQGYTPAVSGTDLFRFEPRRRPDQRLADITSDARRSTYQVEVSNTARLEPGQWVRVRFNSPEAAADMLHPREPRSNWTRIIRSAGIFEIHQIQEIEGNVVRFVEPLQMTLRRSYQPYLATHEVIEEAGVEDIAFMGGWLGYFVHHRSALDDYAWNTLKFVNVSNGWVRRCSFLNISTAVNFDSVASSSILQITLAGAMGHTSIHARRGYGVLAGLIEDTAGYWHGPGTGYYAAGTVFWRYDMAPRQQIDSHSTMPYATLLDHVNGGTMMGSGGPQAGFPNHLRWLVAWNFRHGGRDNELYDFWRGRPAFVNPILVGLHGNDVRVNIDTVKINEAQGRKVEPESLYEAQLVHRLGQLPSWIPKARAEWENLRARPLPDHLHPDRLLEARSSHAYPNRFDVDEFVRDAALLPFRVNEQAFVRPVTAGGTGRITADRTLLRQCLYNLMIYAFEFDTREMELQAGRQSGAERDTIVFEITAANGSRPPRNSRERDLTAARDLARLLGGQIEIADISDSAIRLRLEVPAQPTD